MYGGTYIAFAITFGRAYKLWVHDVDVFDCSHLLNGSVSHLTPPRLLFCRLHTYVHVVVLTQMQTKWRPPHEACRLSYKHWQHCSMYDKHPATTGQTIRAQAYLHSLFISSSAPNPSLSVVKGVKWEAKSRANVLFPTVISTKFKLP